MCYMYILLSYINLILIKVIVLNYVAMTTIIDNITTYMHNTGVHIQSIG